MNTTQRVVTEIPLAELWTERGPLPAARGRALGRADIGVLLSRGPVQFVVADVGRPLRWVPVEERYVFWKLEVRPHLVEDPERPFDIFHFPEGYAYLASAWQGDRLDDPAFVLLERHH